MYVYKLPAHAWAVDNEKGREKRSHAIKQRTASDLEKKVNSLDKIGDKRETNRKKES